MRCCSCAHETLEWIRFGEVIKEVVDLSKARGRGGWTDFIRFYSGVQTPDMCVYRCRCKSSQHQTCKQDNNTTLTFSNLSWPGYISYVNCQPITLFYSSISNLHFSPKVTSDALNGLFLGEPINRLAIVTRESCTTENPAWKNFAYSLIYTNILPI